MGQERENLGTYLRGEGWRNDNVVDVTDEVNVDVLLLQLGLGLFDDESMACIVEEWA